MADLALNMGLIELEFRTHTRRHEVSSSPTGVLGLCTDFQTCCRKQAAGYNPKQPVGGYC